MLKDSKNCIREVELEAWVILACLLHTNFLVTLSNGNNTGGLTNYLDNYVFVIALVIFVLILLYQNRQLNRKYSIQLTKEKELTQNAVKTKDYYLKLFNDFPTMVWQTNKEGVVTYCNNSWLDFLGKKPNSEQLYHWSFAVHPVDLIKANKTYNNALVKEEAYQIGYRKSYHESEYRCIYEIATPYYNEKNQFAGFLSIGYDNTDKRVLEESIKHSEIVYHNLIEKCPMGILIFVLKEGQLLFTKGNKAAAQMLQFSLSEKEGHSLTSLFPNMVNAVSEKRFIDCAESGNSIYLSQILYIEGKVQATYELYVFQITENKIAILFRDITYQKDVQSDLAKKTERLRINHKLDQAILNAQSIKDIAKNAFNQLSEWMPFSLGSICVIDPITQTANPIALYNAQGDHNFAHPDIPLSEYGIDDTLLNGNVSIIEPLTERNANTPMRKALLKEGVCALMNVPLNYQKTLIGTINFGSTKCGVFTKDNQDFAVQMADIIAIAIKQRQLHDLVLKHTEELENKVKERTLQLETANAELSAFTYSVSHDLRSPLRAIDGFSKVLEEDYTDNLDEQAKYYIERVRSATQRMGHIIDDLLYLSKVSRMTLSREKLNVSKLAEATVFNFHTVNPTRKYVAKIQPDVWVEADPNLLLIIMENLLSNAWKYSSKNEISEIEFGTFENEGEIIYYIKDNGVGFDMQYEDKLFKAFQRLHHSTEFEGNGIGLATVKRIIGHHGGKIWAESELDKGSTFYFTLK